MTAENEGDSIPMPIQAALTQPLLQERMSRLSILKLQVDPETCQKLPDNLPQVNYILKRAMRFGIKKNLSQVAIGHASPDKV